MGGNSFSRTSVDDPNSNSISLLMEVRLDLSSMAIRPRVARLPWITRKSCSSVTTPRIRSMKAVTCSGVSFRTSGSTIPVAGWVFPALDRCGFERPIVRACQPWDRSTSPQFIDELEDQPCARLAGFRWPPDSRNRAGPAVRGRPVPSPPPAPGASAGTGPGTGACGKARSPARRRQGV